MKTIVILLNVALVLLTLILIFGEDEEQEISAAPSTFVQQERSEKKSAKEIFQEHGFFVGKNHELTPVATPRVAPPYKWIIELRIIGFEQSPGGFAKPQTWHCTL